MVEGVPDDQTEDDPRDTTVRTLHSDDEKEPGQLRVPPLTNDSEEKSPDVTKFVYEIKYTDLQEYRERVYSDFFPVKNIPFRILMFPFGNPVSTQSYISAYIELDSEEIHKHAQGWTVWASFEMKVINHSTTPEDQPPHRSRHNFNARVRDQGFAELLSLDSIRNPASGYLDENGILRIEAAITIEEICEPQQTYGFSSYYPSRDSKKNTGFVGLKNQGATCYMNSFLQTLYNIPFFRKAVYSLPTEELKDLDPMDTSYHVSEEEQKDEKPESNIPLAMQRVFHDLQFNELSVGTKRLTRAFGWSSAEAFQQHDVQEFSRVLCDVLDRKMASTKQKDTITKMFEAKYENYVECTEVEYGSARMETYHDLSLTVKGCSNVEESLQQYIALETLEGDNLYRTEKHGMQPAKKGIKFHSFPPILQLQLKRFEYDHTTGHMMKVNERFAYPKTLDLNPFVGIRADHKEKENESESIQDVPETNNTEESVEKPKKNSTETYRLDDYKYELHSVLVHSGNVYGGHYQVFIRPLAKGDQWFRFDDDQVERAQEQFALDDNFGGCDENNELIKKNSNAYMLVYVQKNKIQQFLTPLEDEDVPQHLKDRFEREIQQKRLAKQQQEDDRLKKPIRILTEGNLKTHHGLELEDGRQWETFKVYKTDSLATFKRKAEQVFNIPADRQQYWTYTKRQNGTVRANKKVKRDEMHQSFDDFHKDCFFLRECEEDFYAQYTDEALNTNVKLIFYKLFDPEKMQLSFAGTGLFEKQAPLSCVIDEFREHVSLPSSQKLEVYEEEYARKKKINHLESSKKLAELQIVSGDILVFEPSNSETTASNTTTSTSTSTTSNTATTSSSTSATTSSSTSATTSSSTSATTSSSTSATTSTSTPATTSTSTPATTSTSTPAITSTSTPATTSSSQTSIEGSDVSMADSHNNILLSNGLSHSSPNSMNGTGTTNSTIPGMNGYASDEDVDMTKTGSTTKAQLPVHDPSFYPKAKNAKEQMVYINSYVTVYFLPLTAQDQLKVHQSLTMDTGAQTSLTSPEYCSLHKPTGTMHYNPHIDPIYFSVLPSLVKFQIDTAREHFKSCGGRFSITLSEQTKYLPLLKFLSEIFNTPHNRIRLHIRDALQNVPQKDIDIDQADMELHDVIHRYQQDPYAVYYEIMEYTYEELENNQLVKLKWRPPRRHKDLETMKFLVPDLSRIENVIAKAGEHLVEDGKIKKEDAQHLRLLKYTDGKAASVVDSLAHFDDLQRSVYGIHHIEYCIDLVTEKESNMGLEDRLLWIWTANKAGLTFTAVPGSYPYPIVIKQGNKLSELREKIADQMLISAEELKKWSFYLINTQFSIDNPEIKEEQVLLDLPRIEEDSRNICGVAESGNSKKRKHPPSSFSMYEQPSLKIKG